MKNLCDIFLLWHEETGTYDLSGKLKVYPGGSAKPEQVFRMAEEYRRAAEILLNLKRKGDPLSLAPCRLAAIHSIELFLNALLLHKGHEPAQVRALQHDLATRKDIAIANGLGLRKRTHMHLSELASSREYLVARYEPQMSTMVSQINRLIATLNEVALKVAGIMKMGAR